MIRILICFTTTLMALTAVIPSAHAQDSETTGQSYPDGHGGEVFFPMGEVSFADEVVEFEVGSPGPREIHANADQILGVPDITRNEDGFVSLGCAGELVLQFTDNQLIDIPGPDLYVFEIGPDVEPTALAVSEDGENWTRVGSISGGKAEIDLAPYVNRGASFRYIKLVDLKQACSSATPGADIDAVGAIGSASTIALDSAVLFDSGRYELKPGAYEALDEVIDGIHEPDASEVEVAGHTDSVGSDEDNMQLSADRARAVADYLVESNRFPTDAVTTRAHGESRPVASNETEAGRARNRRVELTVRTTRGSEASDASRIEILGLWSGSGESRGRVLEMRRDENGIRADYDFDNSVLIGEFTDETTFEGFWIKDRSGRRCDSKKDGREYWGHIRLEFESADLDAFDGFWLYCGDDPQTDDWKSSGWKNMKRML